MVPTLVYIACQLKGENITQKELQQQQKSQQSLSEKERENEQINLI
jgi:hypothetical protein